jgi:hypothetical protein
MPVDGHYGVVNEVVKKEESGRRSNSSLDIIM